MDALVIRDELGKQELATYDKGMIETIKKTVAKKATDEELYMFLQIAASHGLNPFKKEIYFIKYKEDPQIMTSRDGYLSIASRDPLFEGVQSFAVFENDDFEMEIEKAEVVDVKHNFKHKDRGNLVGAWAVAEKKGQRPIYAYMDYREYKQAGNVWAKYKSAMIRKVAEVDVLKRIAGITGLISQEEMPHRYSLENNQKQVIEPPESTPKDIKKQDLIEITPEDDEEGFVEDIVASDWLHKIRKKIEVTGFAVNKTTVEKQCEKLIDDSESDFNEEMKERVLKLIK